MKFCIKLAFIVTIRDTLSFSHNGTSAHIINKNYRCLSLLTYVTQFIAKYYDNSKYIGEIHSRNGWEHKQVKGALL